MIASSGGDRIVRTLASHGVQTLFALCGGHISPILVAARQQGLAVVDVRDEAAAVFAADAEARLTGRPGVAAVTAGPGVANVLTALTNATLAQSPVVLLCGATATVLKGRGALQDIDQQALLAPHVKWFRSVRRVRDVRPLLNEAFAAAAGGIPGPVALECPVDVLYPEPTVREWYGLARQHDGVSARMRRLYLDWHLSRLFGATAAEAEPSGAAQSGPDGLLPRRRNVARLAALVNRARRPVLLVGSQAMRGPGDVAGFVDAIESLGIPTYLSGMARGLLGAVHPLHRRHERKAALREADLVMLAGVPCDFRLDYGRHINSRATVVTINRTRTSLYQNRRPTLALHADADLVLRALSKVGPRGNGAWNDWLETTRQRDRQRDEDIERRALESGALVNPVALFRTLDMVLGDDAVIVADGGDFVATASYVLRPRRPLSWLDPGVFGTLGVGGGFAAGVHAARPSAELWLLWGDGAAGYSIAELDTFVRCGIGLVALIGNDASWAQIAREQVAILGDPTGTVLRRTDYEQIARGWGAEGFRLESDGDAASVLASARQVARSGRPAVVNVILAPSTFRAGSISM